jgi:hypothetical protein
MSNYRLLTAVLVSASLAAMTPIYGQGGRTMLTPMDHIEIQQLVSKYAYALDTGADNGYAYAELFSPDATFIGMNQGPKGRAYKGREALAALARGGKRGPLYVSHFSTGVIIEPTADGATGKVYVVMVEPAEGGTPGAITNGGHYQDAYVKTPAGWRFKTRVFYASELSATPKQLQSPPSDAPVGSAGPVAPAAPVAPGGAIR